MCSIQEFSLPELLQSCGFATKEQCLASCVSNGPLHAALNFVMSIYYLMRSTPEDLPDNIRAYIENKIRNEWQLRYEFNNRVLEDGLYRYFNYKIPCRANGDRDIVYTRIREAGYSYMRFAQEMCHQISPDAKNNTWEKIVDRVNLAEGYGSLEEISEIKAFFKTLTQENFNEKFMELGYSQEFASNLKKRLSNRQNNHTALDFLETGIGMEYRDDDLFFTMAENGTFNTNSENVTFAFELNDQVIKYCNYVKTGDNNQFRRNYLDPDIPVSRCKFIHRNGINILPPSLYLPVILWDIDNKRIRNYKNGTNLTPHTRYAVIPTVLFRPNEDAVCLHSEEGTDQNLTLPAVIQCQEEESVTIKTFHDEYQIRFGGGRLLDYDKILAISPDKRKYRYFSSEEHPFKDDFVSGKDSVTIALDNDDNNQKKFCLDKWEIPTDYLQKKCTISIKGKTFNNIVFWPRQTLAKLENATRDCYPIREKVHIALGTNARIPFLPGHSQREIRIWGHPVLLTIHRSGACLSLAGKTFFLSSRQEIMIDKKDFEDSRFTYYQGTDQGAYERMTTEVVTTVNGAQLFYAAKHKLRLPESSLNLLAIERIYEKFTEREISLYMFFNRGKNRQDLQYDKTALVPRRSLSQIIFEGNGGNLGRDWSFKFNIIDTTIAPVNNSCISSISHPIARVIAQQSDRFLYCLPVEKQDGAFITIPITGENSSVACGTGLTLTETVNLSTVFDEDLQNTFGLLCFFVYKSNGICNRYSPGFFLRNPREVSQEGLSNLQKALQLRNIEMLHSEFSGEGHGEFIEKVFENAESINAAHFFDMFFNKIRQDGKYIESSSFAFRAADYWIPRLFTVNGNQSSAQRRINQHWDPELFGYKELQRYLPETMNEQIRQELASDINGLTMTSLHYYLLLKARTNLPDAEGQFKFFLQETFSTTQPAPFFHEKIVFLIRLFVDPRYRESNFEDLYENSIKAVDELARRIHCWKKNPHLSDINQMGWSQNGRFDSNHPYYYTEQYFRGELVYWRTMSAQELGFGALRNLLLLKIALLASKDSETTDLFNNLI